MDILSLHLIYNPQKKEMEFCMCHNKSGHWNHFFFAHDTLECADSTVSSRVVASLREEQALGEW